MKQDYCWIVTDDPVGSNIFKEKQPEVMQKYFNRDNTDKWTVIAISQYLHQEEIDFLLISLHEE